MRDYRRRPRLQYQADSVQNLTTLPRDLDERSFGLENLDTQTADKVLGLLRSSFSIVTAEVVLVGISAAYHASKVSPPTS